MYLENRIGREVLLNKGDYMMLAQAIMTVGGALKQRKGNVMDRKVLVALTATKLWNALTEFTHEQEPNIRLATDVDPEAFRNYLLDVVAEACQLIKEKKGMK